MVFTSPFAVIAGLDPAIQKARNAPSLFTKFLSRGFDESCEADAALRRLLDARIKSGHDVF
ncbi:MAG: hypothetical protein C0454_05545 [Parvibaculum sp.]|nr:hypothetical protein [Parvibaculum sp.]